MGQEIQHTDCWLSQCCVNAVSRQHSCGQQPSSECTGCPQGKPFPTSHPGVSVGNYAWLSPRSRKPSLLCSCHQHHCLGRGLVTVVDCKVRGGRDVTHGDLRFFKAAGSEPFFPAIRRLLVIKFVAGKDDLEFLMGNMEARRALLVHDWIVRRLSLCSQLFR